LHNAPSSVLSLLRPNRQKLPGADFGVEAQDSCSGWIPHPIPIPFRKVVKD
jgi:hypothetical protein